MNCDNFSGLLLVNKVADGNDVSSDGIQHLYDIMLSDSLFCHVLSDYCDGCRVNGEVKSVHRDVQSGSDGLDGDIDVSVRRPIAHFDERQQADVVGTRKDIAGQA